MKNTVSTVERQPISGINTTPLIDVMLVLLIMFIIIIPVTTHKVPIELPYSGPNDGTPPPIRQLEIAANGALRWDGTPITQTQLAERLDVMTTDPDRPFLQIHANGEARYEIVDEHLATIARSGVRQLGFVGNRNFADAL